MSMLSQKQSSLTLGNTWCPGVLFKSGEADIKTDSFIFYILQA